ncbi:efflux RND transporter periplasmic adaptor subunit [Candidatus Binatia bacterium]|nr:efflux RND transporter periplasmic adaptor subunit [Candidatus Binatia bacterium]
MKLLRIAALVAVVLAGVVVGRLILRTPPAPSGEHVADDHEDEATAGPHGGRLLHDGAFTAEVKIVDEGAASELRVWLADDGRAIAAADASVRVSLQRLGGRTDAFVLEPRGDFFAGDRPVAEPHSFDVAVDATWRGVAHRWTYPSYEARVVLTPEAATRAGIGVENAGGRTLDTRLRLNGRIVPNEDRLAHVLPRFAGIVREVRKRIGDPVAKGEVMAVVQSNQSLQTYEVRSEIAGTVIQKHVTPGEFVAEGDDLYTVANLETVWIDLDVYRADFPRVAVGQPVTLDAGEGVPRAEGRLDYISPFGSSNTQTMLARVILPNEGLAWRPGLFVTGEVVVDRAAVPLAVRASALQTMGRWTVVFVQDGDVYQAVPVTTGRRDADWVEVLSGLDPGQRYVAKNSFVLKADVGKSGAQHAD